MSDIVGVISEMVGSSSYHLMRNSKGSLGREVERFRDSGEFSDVILVSDDGDTFPAHKLVLASHSQKLRRILTKLQPGPLSLYLAGVSTTDLSSLLSFIYSGQARVAQTALNTFMAAAETLQVTGLVEDGEEEEVIDENNDEMNEHEDLRELEEKNMMEELDTKNRSKKQETNQDDINLPGDMDSSAEVKNDDFENEPQPDTTIKEEEDIEDDWDDATTVSFEFIKSGRSNGDGILVTHDRNFKVSQKFFN